MRDFSSFKLTMDYCFKWSSARLLQVLSSTRAEGEELHSSAKLHVHCILGFTQTQMINISGELALISQWKVELSALCENKQNMSFFLVHFVRNVSDL